MGLLSHGQVVSTLKSKARIKSLLEISPVKHAALSTDIVAYPMCFAALTTDLAIQSADLAGLATDIVSVLMDCPRVTACFAGVITDIVAQSADVAKIFLYRPDPS